MDFFLKSREAKRKPSPCSLRSQTSVAAEPHQGEGSITRHGATLCLMEGARHFLVLWGGDLEVTSTCHRVDSRVQRKPDNKMGEKEKSKQ